MNTTIRNLIVAAPLATAALTFTPGAAMASDHGPVVIAQPTGHGDPQPNPGDKAPAPKPTEPKGPQDKAPLPKPTKPHGPGDVSIPKPCPTHGVDCTPDDDKDGPHGSGNGDGGSSDDASLQLPTRIDAGTASQDEQGGMELTWLLAGGAVVSASGVAIAARKRTRRDA